MGGTETNVTDAERAALHRELLQLAGYTNIVTRKGWFDDPEFGARELEYLFDEDKYEAAPALTIDWLLSQLPPHVEVTFFCADGNSVVRLIPKRFDLLFGKVPIGDNLEQARRDALLLAAHDYRKAAGNG